MRKNQPIAFVWTSDQGRVSALRDGARSFLLVLFGLCVAVLASAPAFAQQSEDPRSGPDRQQQRPYDSELFQLAEVLGAIHYLRELCGAEEGQLWRDQMSALVEAEGTSARRRAALVRSFNRGYRGYSRTYRSCTGLARLAINRFMQEGTTLAQRMLAAAG
jgi:uncharacterized protein (TIGR02301 family)